MNSPDHHLAEESVAENPLPATPEAVPQKLPVQRHGWPEGLGVTGSLQSLLGTVVIAVFVITFIVQAFQIPSPSMEDTLLVGDYLLVNKLCYGGG